MAVHWRSKSLGAGVDYCPKGPASMTTVAPTFTVGWVLIDQNSELLGLRAIYKGNLCPGTASRLTDFSSSKNVQTFVNPWACSRDLQILQATDSSLFSKALTRSRDLQILQATGSSLSSKALMGSRDLLFQFFYCFQDLHNGRATALEHVDLFKSCQQSINLVFTIQQK